MSARAATGPQRPAGVDEILLPGVPANIRPGRFKVEAVTNDLYNIAERLAELNPRLAVNITEDTEGGQKAYTIVEETETGPQVVFRCSVLDARVIEHVRYLLKVPFTERFAQAEKLADKYEKDCEMSASDKLVEELGLPMMRDLRELGFLGEYSHGGDASRSRKGFGRG